jgi:ABC-type polysaccharide/polyol phosphate export permease
MAFALFVFGVPLEASFPVFLAACLLGMVTFASIGLLIAAGPRTVEGVSGLMNLVMLPMWLFSGVFFSYERFPEFAHGLIRLLPLTATVDTLRGLMVEGATLASLALPLAVQAFWALAAFALALRVFRWE